MAKNWTPTAKGRRTRIKPDLYEGLRAFARQQKDIVAAAKEEDLRIQQRNEQWDRSQKETESNVLENRRQLQEAENEKFNTRAKAITNRRDTEVDRLKGEAKIAEKRASDWQALTPKLAKSITDVATTGYRLADLHYGTKQYNEADAKGEIDLIYQSQIFKDADGLVNLEASKIKLEAMRKNDPEAFKWVKDRLNLSWSKGQELTMADIRETFDQAAALFKRDIVTSGFKYDETSIDEIWELRAGEMIAKAGFDENSKEAIEIRKRFRKIALNEKFGYVTQKDEEKRATDQKDNVKWFTNDPKGEAGNERLNNLIMDGMEVNWRYDAKTGRYNLKPIDEQLKLHDRVQTVGGILVKHDRYQKIGGSRGLKLFREEFYERKLPHKQGEKPEYNHEKFPEDWEVYEKAYWEEQKKRNNNRESARQSDGQASIAMIDRVTDPNSQLLEGEERIDPLDTSEGGGFDQIIEIAKSAPTIAARDHAYSKIDYTVSKSNKYNLTLHKAMLKAHVSGDAAGWIKIYNQIKDPAIKQAWENKYQLATVFLEAGENFESIEEFSEKQVLRRVGGAPTIPGTNKLKQNYEDQKAELNQYTHWYVENNIGRLKEEFGGDVTAFFRKMKDEVSDEFQDKNSKRFPTVQAGGTFSLPGQKTLLFANHIRGGSNDQEVKTIKDWTQKMRPYLNPVDSSHPSLITYEKTRVPNIGDLIANDEVLTDSEARNIARGIEEGGGVGNYIHIRGDLKELADMHPEWTARDIVNRVLEKKGFKHRLPPDEETLLNWSGYKAKKPRRVDVKNIIYYRDIMNETKGDFFKREDLVSRNRTYVPGSGPMELIL